MTKSELYDKALELRSKGLNYCEISRQIDINRTTVMEWCKGKVDKTKLKGNREIRCKVDNDTFSKHVSDSYSIAEVLKKCGLKVAGANYKGFHKRIKDLGISDDHFTGQGHLKGKHNPYVSEISIEDSFVIDGTLGTGNLKKKILKYKLKEYVCDECGIFEWRGENISLHLDHINGVNNDNRLENLRFLCPNCHSLTPTYCGKNKVI